MTDAEYIAALEKVAEAARAWASQGLHSGDCVAHTNREGDSATCACGADDITDAVAALDALPTADALSGKQEGE